MHKKSLIIGINNYQHFSVLDNCINDAEDMHTFMQKIGFESTLLIDSMRWSRKSAHFLHKLGKNGGAKKVKKAS